MVSETSPLSESAQQGDGPVTTTVGSQVFMPMIVKRWPPVPYSPVFSPAESPIWDSPVVLQWQATAPLEAYPIDGYVLEESQDADFTSATVHTVPVSEVPFTLPQKTFGTMGFFNYRVQAHNVWGLGPYSDPLQVLLLSKRDDFDYPQTGWAPRRTSYWDLGVMAADYGVGELVTRVEDKFDFAIFSPMQPAPATPYSIKMLTQVIHKANETSYGIVFGGNEGSFCGVNRWNAADPNGCFSHYYRLNVIWGGYLKYGLARIDGHRNISGGGDGYGVDWGYDALQWYEGSANGWNEWEIRVYDTGFAVYVNGHLMNVKPETTYIHDAFYGIFSSTYEYNGARFRHDYYYVEPLQGAAAIPPTALSLSGASGEVQ